ncbi:MAG TPA: hypothetical protein VFJ19_13190 [Nocardioidaceae bacterium]|nr:hypothetical protein [Nocardioidaceae bacterium]
MSERERRELTEASVSTIGEAPTDTLFSSLPPNGWGEVATKRDLEVLAARTDPRFDVLEAKLGSMMATFDAKIRALQWIVGLLTVLVAAVLATLIAS